MAHPLRRPGRLLLGGHGAVLVASVDITPADLTAVRTAGYSDDLPPPRAVDQPLEANVLGLAGGLLDEPVYVVSVDALYGGSLGTELARLLGCPRDRVLVVASHTHFAPATDPGLPRLGHTGVDYVRRAAERIADAVRGGAWREGARVRLGTSQVPEHLFVNRRRPILGVGLRVGRLGKVVAAPNPEGPTDRTLRLFEVLDEGGALLAVGWGVSCHPVCSPDRHAISSDFPGLVRNHLRRAGVEVPVLFFQGCSGDVRPAATSRRPPRSLRGLVLYVLAGSRIFVPQTRPDYESWCSELAAAAVDARESCGDAVAVRPALRRAAAEPRGRWDRRPEMGVVRLADDVALLTVNAEVVSRRVEDLSVAFGQAVVIPATCADEVIGYWPTSDMLREGGYEACGSQAFFPSVDWERDDPDTLWRTLLAAVLDESEPVADPAT